MEYFGDQHLWERVEVDNVSSLVLLRRNLSYRPTGKKEGGFLTRARIVLSERSFCVAFNKECCDGGKNSMAVPNG